MRKEGRFGRVGFLLLGLGFSGLGFIGAVLPVMPSTVFFILALWSFKRSSPRLEAWLLDSRVIGPTLRDWDRDRSMKRRTKILAIAMIWLAIGGSIWVVHKLWVRIMLGLIALSLTVYLARVREAPNS